MVLLSVRSGLTATRSCTDVNNAGARGAVGGNPCRPKEGLPKMIALKAEASRGLSLQPSLVNPEPCNKGPDSLLPL